MSICCREYVVLVHQRQTYLYTCIVLAVKRLQHKYSCLSIMNADYIYLFMQHPLHCEIVSVACFQKGLVVLQCCPCFSIIIGSVTWSNTHRLQPMQVLMFILLYRDQVLYPCNIHKAKRCAYSLIH